MTLAPSPPGWHAGRKWCFFKRKWLSSGLNCLRLSQFLPPDVKVPSTAWSVLEHEGGIAADCRADSQRRFQPMSFGGHFRHYRLSVCWRYRFIRPEHKTAFTARFPVDNRHGRWSPNPLTCLTPRRVTSAAVSIPKDRNAALRAGPTPGIEATSIKSLQKLLLLPFPCSVIKCCQSAFLFPVTREFRPSFFKHRPFGDKTFQAAYLLDLAD